MFGGGELELAGAAVLDVIVEGGEIGGGDFGGGSWGGGGVWRGCGGDFEGARFATLELGAGSEAAVPCWDCGVAAFSLCVFDEDGGVWAGSTLALSAEAFVFGVAVEK